MKKLLCLVALFLAFAAGGLVMAPAAHADSIELIPGCQNGQAAGSATCGSHNSTGSDPIAGPNGLLTKATKIIAIITGIASVIMIIVGGFRYVLSGGDASSVASAKRTIIYASVGIVITIAAGSIVAFVLSKL